ncbi:MAG: DUF6092 family protein [Nitrososphaerota archaeon]|nr:DUF6092 family protein [Aigarchaeota archaeon]MDW8076872.1 DUF6092 family protein [Nitrososphaerota archaeon]
MATESIIEDEHFKLLTFLIVSARGCVDEPPLYGPLRLIDAAERLIGLMDKIGKADEKLRDIMRIIKERKFSVIRDETEFVKLLDELVLKISRIIKEAQSVRS